MGIVCGASKREWTLHLEGDGQAPGLLPEWDRIELKMSGSARWSIVTQNLADPLDGFVVRFRLDEGMPDPMLLVIDREYMAISHGFAATVFRIDARNSVALLEVEYPIYGLQYRPKLGRLIALHEAGAVGFDTSWREVWSAGRDLVRSHHIADDRLCLVYDDGSSETVLLLDGSLSPSGAG